MQSRKFRAHYRLRSAKPLTPTNPPVDRQLIAYPLLTTNGLEEDVLHGVVHKFAKSVPNFAFKLAFMAIWHNGILGETASIDASSAGLLLGWGVFTTIGIKAGRPLWIDHHLHRLRRDAARCDIAVPYSNDELRAALHAVLAANNIGDGLARITATRHDDERWNTASGTDVTLLALESPAVKIRDLRVGFAPTPSQGHLNGVKTTSYLPYFWSWRESHNCGWDEVVLHQSGLVIEASRSSLFWVKGGVLQTTPLELGALDGVGRALVFEWAKSNNIAAVTAELLTTELPACDEAFLISAATGPRAIGTFCLSSGDLSLSHSRPVFDSLRAWWDIQ